MNWFKRFLIVSALKKVVDWLMKITGGVKMNAALLRLLRVAVAVIVAGVVQTYGQSDWYLAIAPFLNAVGKYLREKYKISWLPF